MRRVAQLRKAGRCSQAAWTKRRPTRNASGRRRDINPPTLDYQGPGSIDGQWVTGTFVAGPSLSETLNLVAGNSNVFSGDSGSPQVNLLQLRDLTPVPEPTSLALVGLGAFGLLARRRRA
jgi:hypothetical protein